jgi:hypothetical protein
MLCSAMQKAVTTEHTGGWPMPLDQLVGIAQDCFGRGEFEAAFYCLLATVHLARGDSKRLREIARIATEQATTLVEIAPAHRLAQQRGGCCLFDTLSRIAECRAELAYTRDLLKGCKF